MTFSFAEKRARSVLSKSGIPGADYCVNPYVGCSHACRYCYATFMKRFTDHSEPWGTFVDAKANAPEALCRELRRARPGRVMVSSVTDPYQPVERKCRLTRQCLEALLESDMQVGILTKSPLVLRDLDLFKRFGDRVEVGLTVTTDDESMRRLFEPHAPAVALRVKALRTLRERGVATYAFIGPVLPMNPKRLVRMLRPSVDDVLISRMNYITKTAGLYRKHGLHRWLDRAHLDEVVATLKDGFADKAEEC
jgi:DNA repair photolyase